MEHAVQKTRLASVSRAAKVAAAAALATVLAAPAARAGDRETVEAFYTQILSGTTSADLESRMAKVISPDWQSLGDYGAKAKTRGQFVAQLQGLGKVIPDLKFSVVEILPAGPGRYVVRSRAQAKPVGEFLGVPPSGKAFDIMTIDIHTVAHGKIVTSYHVEDWMGAAAQLRAP